ncbi:plasmid partition protein [Streptacidiphilus sp. P02-A3a]|uniref:plasmid partition protein n=1 Tax=Streptacidiphilus sp. P02-A3a TaxID=2704468 RepID=UPI0015FC8B55|nr:plasmid partition protein [Streptacidiphilus sp. P02-A3a]QMU68354.1 plasmid partition protein [Streptacidiphilus sp. P02-A3a]
MIIAHISPRTGGKTTSAGWQAHALHERGYDVQAFEADYSGQFAEWDARAGGFPFPVQQQASPMFHKNVPPTLLIGQIGVVDCGHAEDHRAIVQSVLRVADLAILNAAPTTADIDRIERLPMRALIDGIATLRPDDTPPPTWVLLNRTGNGVKATKQYKDYLRDNGWNVFTTTIPQTQLYAQSVLLPVTARGSAYDELTTEMLSRGLLPQIEVTL